MATESKAEGPEKAAVEPLMSVPLAEDDVPVLHGPVDAAAGPAAGSGCVLCSVPLCFPSLPCLFSTLCTFSPLTHRCALTPCFTAVSLTCVSFCCVCVFFVSLCVTVWGVHSFTITVSTTNGGRSTADDSGVDDTGLPLLLFNKRVTVNIPQSALLEIPYLRARTENGGPLSRRSSLELK